MSKLVKAICVEKTWSDATPPAYETSYRIGVSLQHYVWLTEQMLKQSESQALRDAVSVVKDAVIEEVFGEFRPHFRAVQLALWNRDIEAARAALSAMETQMFSQEE